MTRLLLINLFLLLTFFSALAVENGLPFSRSYYPEEMGGWPQNWGAVQDASGLIYFVNGQAIIQYDGSNWTKLNHPQNDRPLSIAKTDLNQIFIGYRNDIAFIDKDSLSNQKVIHSLSKYIPDSLKTFSQIWKISSEGNNIYFQDIYNIIHLRLIGENPEWWQWSIIRAPGNKIIWSVNNIADKIYVGVKGVGLCQLRGDSLTHVAGTEKLSQSVIKSVAAYDESTLLIATETYGLQLLENGRIKNFPGPMNEWSKKFQTDKILNLPDKCFAFSSFSGGIAIADQKGNILQVTDDSNGLMDNMVGGLLLDYQSGLWVCQNYGLTRLEINSPFDVYDSKLGLRGNVYDIKRFKGTLFAGTSDGLYYLVAGDNNGKQSHFRKAEISSAEVWTLLALEDKLIIPSTRFTYELKNIGQKPERITNQHDIPVSSLVSEDGHLAYLGTVNEGIIILKNQNGILHTEGRIPDAGQLVLNLNYDKHGNIWFTANEGKVGRIPEQTVISGNPQLFFYDSAQGMDTDGRCSFLNVDDVLYASNDNGLYRYLPEYDTFTLDTMLIDIHPELISKPVFNPGNKELWYWYQNQNLGISSLQESDLDSILTPYNRGIDRIYESVLFEENYAWFGFPGSKLIRINLKRSSNVHEEFLPSIYNIELPYSKNLLERKLHKNDQYYTLLFTENSLRFNYSLPRYDNESANVFQYRLIGLNDNWSNWSSEDYHDFNSLREGLYTFELRGKDSWGEISEVASFSFSILPPWYRTRQAYLSYFFIVIILLVLADRIRHHRIKARNRTLEKIIKERTDEALVQFEIAKQHEIEAQRLRAANMLAATIAHEFNNPLGIIKGIIDLANMKGLSEEKRIEQINKIPPHVQRMSKLVDKLLRIENLKEIDYTADTKIFDLNEIDKKVEDSKVENSNS